MISQSDIGVGSGGEGGGGKEGWAGVRLANPPPPPHQVSSWGGGESGQVTFLRKGSPFPIFFNPKREDSFLLIGVHMYYRNAHHPN